MQKTKVKAKTKTRSENKRISIFVNVQIFSLVAYSVIFLIFSFIALLTDLPQKYDYYYSLVIFIISSFVTGFYTGIKLKENGLLAGILFSLPMNIVVLLISLILSDFSFSVNIIATIIFLIISAAVGGVLAVNKRHRR